MQLHEIAQEKPDLVNKLLPVKVICTRMKIGWMKHAFILSFYYLLRHQTYLESCEQGDTDFYRDSIR